jgi:hypothetical protein
MFVTCAGVTATNIEVYATYIEVPATDIEAPRTGIEIFTAYSEAAQTILENTSTNIRIALLLHA